MPDAADHLARARQDERFAEHVRAGDAEFAYWGVVALFYAAVHYGRAFIRHRGGTPTLSHRTFDSQYIRHGGDDAQYQNYRWLKDESERARYLCVAFTAADIESFRDSRLIPFRDWCISQIAPSP